MNTAFNVDITDVVFETPPSEECPSLARIDLTINGMPATLCPFIMPGKNQSLELYSRSPVQEAWGAHRHAWKSEIFPALEKHMQADWNEEDAKAVTAAVNGAVHAVCNTELRRAFWKSRMSDTPEQRSAALLMGELINAGCNCGIKNVNWHDAYELDTPEQQQAIDILTGFQHMDFGGIRLGVEQGYAVTSIRSIAITRTPITAGLARRVIGTWNSLSASRCKAEDKLRTLISVVCDGD